ncbi:MAG: tetratricopeptide repeat protein [Deltaproteobacteria bacterium]|nr:tetratricopeptide repeat protein [Deltaproteobacteria bacterium]
MANEHLKRRAAPKGVSRGVLLLASVPALVTFIAYLGALGNGFVTWDDGPYVYENPGIRTMDAAFFRWAFTSAVHSNWHPVTIISYAVDYSLWGLDPRGYHLVNNVFHALNASLVFVLTLRVAGLAGAGKEWPGRDRALGTAFVASLLFGLHPLHVESVAWISERKDVLSAFFSILSVLAYLWYAAGKRDHGLVRYSLTFVLLALAIMSKPMAVTMPVVFLILDFYPLERLRAPLKEPGRAILLLLEKVPFFSLSLLSSVMTILAQSKAMPIEGMGLVLHERILVATRAVFFYLYKTVLPINLSPLYPLTKGVTPFSFEYAVPAVAFIISAVSAIALRRHKWFAASWLYYVVTLLPVSGVVQVGVQAAADRYTYMPSIPVFMLAGAGLFAFIRKRRSHGRAIVLPVVLAAGVFIALTGLTIKQTAVWKDGLTLWNRQVRNYPGHAVSYDNRAETYELLGRDEEALADYARAIAVEPGFVDSYIYRGNLLNTLGRHREAIKDFNEVIKRGGAVAGAYNYRGVAHFYLKEYELAEEDFLAAIRLRPAYPDPYHNLSFLYSTLGDHARAEEYRSRAQELGYGG